MPGRRKLLLTVGGAAIGTFAAGGAAWFWLFTPAAETVSETKAVVPPQADPQFLALDALVVPLHLKDGSSRGLTLVVSLDLAGGPGASTRAYYHIPRLRDAFLRALSRPPLLARPEDDRPSVDEIKRRLLDASRAVLGAEAVQAILVQGAD